MKKINSYISNLWFTLIFYAINTRIYIEQFFYISSVQAMTFSIVKQIHLYLNRNRGVSLQKIINKIMYLQEIMLTKNQNSLDLIKVLEFKIFYKYILHSNELINDGFDFNRQEQIEIRRLLDCISHGLINNDYLNEQEVQQILDTCIKRDVKPILNIKRK